jgi:hypothetical protein
MHYFIAHPIGGEIMIVALNNSDANTIKQIRNHVMDIQKDFMKVTLQNHLVPYLLLSNFVAKDLFIE